MSVFRLLRVFKCFTCCSYGARRPGRNVCISGNTGIGISASAGTLTLSQSTVSGNTGGGVRIDNSDYSLVNNFFVNNGNSSNVSGVRVENTNGNSEELAFNTFARNRRSGLNGYALICDGTLLQAKNNIFMLSDSTSQGLITECAVSSSLFDSDSSTSPSGVGSIAANAVFVDGDNGNFHLASGSPGIDAATTAGAPAVDIDGDARPRWCTRHGCGRGGIERC